MTNEEFIQRNRTKDVRRLALSHIPKGVDAQWCLQQIEGWQIARKKLPSWGQEERGGEQGKMNGETLWFPPKLSMEQCSSEQTARYKRSVVERLLPKEKRHRMVDFTGGYGIDFSFIATLFEKSTYIERQPNLCKIARHNFPLLSLESAEIVCSDSFFPKERIQLAFLDPARRDDVGRKTVAIEDCTPDITRLQDKLLEIADIVMVKLSPMLDISRALRSLRNVVEVHVVGVKGECKELIVVQSSWTSQAAKPITKFQVSGSKFLVSGFRFQVPGFHCVNLGEESETFTCSFEEREMVKADYLGRLPEVGEFLYEPNACILKAGMQDVLASKNRLLKLHPQSNLFVNKEFLNEYPGRSFQITEISDFSKGGLCKILDGIKQANLTIRNFPTSVAELRKKLKLKEGGETYLFATTAYDGSWTSQAAEPITWTSQATKPITHILIKCKKP